MSVSAQSKPIRQIVHVIGDGCAALSLAARVDQMPHHRLTLVHPDGAPPRQDHIWGFWQIDGLEAAAELARHKWTCWRIATAEGEALLASEKHAYHALQRSQWESHCSDSARSHGVNFVSQKKLKDVAAAQILDSRPPAIPAGQMIQHFIGWEVTAPSGSFDPTQAILMDFRCDQSRGIHFIYLLPFDDRTALVESTMFAPHREPDIFFETAITHYLAAQCGVTKFTTRRTEAGAIPLGRLPRSSSAMIGLGGNGGAIRPSSGYAFAFIQKQITDIIARAGQTAATTDRGGPLAVRSPHKPVDLWMDEVFVVVLRHWPARSPELFLRMARALDGDEFALFLSGEAGWALRFKVILAMPKWIFIKAVCRLIIGSSKPGASRMVSPSSKRKGA